MVGVGGNRCGVNTTPGREFEAIRLPETTTTTVRVWVFDRGRKGLHEVVITIGVADVVDGILKLLLTWWRCGANTSPGRQFEAIRLPATTTRTTVRGKRLSEVVITVAFGDLVVIVGE